LVKLSTFPLYLDLQVVKGETVGKHRSRLQIVADIHFVVKDGAKKTQIMRRVNLSYKLLGRYLTDVMEAGLVRFGDANSYTLTPRGRDFLNGYQEYSRRYRQLKEQFNDIRHVPSWTRSAPI